MITEENKESLTSPYTVLDVPADCERMPEFSIFIAGNAHVFPSFSFSHSPPPPPPTVIELLLYLLERNVIQMKTVLLALHPGDKALCLYLGPAGKPDGGSPLDKVR